ncbi:MAG: nitrous oxide reductase family maturation protein NosD [Balneolales bacterium]|nr:nitrous oxide reductase family maturation protein NosD [Balneolales bacterium]
MKNLSRRIFILLFLLLFAGSSLLAAPSASPSAEREIRVSGNIAKAVENARPGDVLRIVAGLYEETEITIKTSRISLLADPGAIIDGGGKGHIFIINADSVTIDGFKLRNTGLSHVRDWAAIRVESAVFAEIRNNELENNMFGIYLSRTKDSLIENNRISGGGDRESNSGNGIHLFDTERIQVRGNIIQHHRDGIYLEFAKEVRITDNKATDNRRYGLHYMFSKDSEYSRNEFRRNNAGVAVMYSQNVDMSGNIFADNLGPASYGILLKDIDNSLIGNNHFLNNTIGIYSEGSNNVRVEHNRFERNGWAVKIWANSTRNVFTGNAFTDNTFDVATNSSRHYNTFERNYWSAYDGYDLEGDGIGDVPHRPVRLYSIIVERNPIALILHRSLFIDFLDLAERVMPALTPQTLVDDYPLMKSPLP